MKLNDIQVKHCAKILDILALTAIAPVLSDLTGIGEITAFSITKILILTSFAITLELLALTTLGRIKNEY